MGASNPPNSWQRLLSITAVLAAVLKTSDVADLVTTLMHKNPDSPPQKDLP
jgi:hypothetical protein